MTNVNTKLWRKSILLTLVGTIVLLLLWQLTPNPYDRVAMVVSVSSDGRYAISSHRDNRLVLWDLETRKQRVISREANIYSAYFIQGDDSFLWQDIDDQVHVTDVFAKERLTFEGEATYGHLIDSNLRHYVWSDIGWGIYSKQIDDTQQILKAADGRAFLGFGKLLNMAWNTEEALLLASGYGYFFDGDRDLEEESKRRQYSLVNGVSLWSTSTLEPLFKLPGNSAKTHATLSPDGRFAVSVDENRLSYIWATDTGERAYIIGSSLTSGQYIGGDELGDPANWNNEGAHLQYPADFPKGFHGGPMVAVQFISDTHYLTFYYSQPYAVMWELGDPFAHAIVPLGEDPFPSVNAYARNASIATAPAAHRLVTGQRDRGGINVYDFDPDTQTLTLVWTPRLKPFWWPF